MATGRSDYPNQVNNVLCFPYIFRGALDSGAVTITPEMEIAAVRPSPIWPRPSRARRPQPPTLERRFLWSDYLIPKPFDPRLMLKIATAVAQSAADSGVAQRPITDMDAYRQRLESFVYASGTIMKPIFAAAKNRP